MRALLVEELAPDYGGCVLKEIDIPAPGPGEVQVRVKAAAVNFPDLLQTRGEYQHRPALPFIPGMEIAGEVSALGEGVDAFAVGDPVVGGARIGGFSEYAVTYVSLVRRAQLQAGEWVLVHGAAGGVGLAAVDLAKHLGARVIAASASDEKLAIVQAEYAPDAVVNVSGGFREKVKEITGGRGADVIYDPVGGDVFDESTRCIAFDGRLLVVGFASGRLPVLPVNMALIKGFSVMGVRAGEYGRQFPERGRENQAAIWALADAMKPRVDREYPLSDWRAAFDSLAERKVVGKTIVRPDL